MAKPKVTPFAKMTGAAREKRGKQLAANPSTRHLAPAEFLTVDQRKKRSENTFLASPITPGSRTTQRDLRTQRHAAEVLEFGRDPIGKAQTWERETVPGYFDKYRELLHESARNIQGFGQQSVQQAEGLVRAPAPMPEGLSEENQRVWAQAQGVSADRLRSQGMGMAEQARIANTFSNRLADEVVPGRKVDAQIAARGKTDDVRAKVGAWRTDFNAKAVDAEERSLLAQAALSQKAAEALQDARLAAAKLRLDQAREARQASDADADRLSREEMAAAKRAAADAKKAQKKWLEPAGQNRFANQFTQAKQVAAKARSNGATRAEIARALTAGDPKAGIPRIESADAVAAALDVVYLGALTGGTVKRLHGANMPVDRLGAPTFARGGAAARRRQRQLEAQTARLVAARVAKQGKAMGDFLGSAKPDQPVEQGK